MLKIAHFEYFMYQGRPAWILTYLHICCLFSGITRENKQVTVIPVTWPLHLLNALQLLNAFLQERHTARKVDVANQLSNGVSVAFCVSAGHLQWWREMGQLWLYVVKGSVFTKTILKSNRLLVMPDTKQIGNAPHLSKPPTKKGAQPFGNPATEWMDEFRFDCGNKGSDV